jgi:hypothetical protein
MATVEGEQDPTLLLEVKGFEDNQRTAKHDGVRRWVRGEQMGEARAMGVPRMLESADAGTGTRYLLNPM